ncbi:MAG: hypothetical protein R6X02_09815 [Enhygromyxa sp.]
MPFDDARFVLHIGGRAGGRFVGPDTAAPTSFGGGLSFGLGVRLWQGLYLEASVGEGVFQNPEPLESFRHLGTHEDTPVSLVEGPEPSPLLVGQILLGARYEVRTARTSRVRPSVFLGATHLHEATLADFAREPGKTLAGTGKFIRHRTGVQAGFGLRVPFPARWGRAAPRFSGRFDADVAYYLDRQPGRVQAGLGAGVQVVF